MLKPVYICLLSALFLTDFEESVSQNILPPFITKSSESWADSLFRTMTEEEKIGQLFMVAAFSNKDQQHVNDISDLISCYHVGGLIFFQGGPIRQAQLTNYYQSISKIPLFIAIDGEWGLSMRLDSTIRFPRAMTLGAMSSDSLIYNMGLEIGRQCKAIGIQVNFAPDIDINNNPLNPIINSRSFGEDKNAVAKKGLLYMKGLQENQILACGKHFPGHGNVDSDSHFTLPVIKSAKSTLDSMELVPFRTLINGGLASMMVAHLYIPALDSTPDQASTLSKKIVTDLLKKEMGFNGLIFTDALIMKGVSAFYSPGSLEVIALKAGNDILLNTESVPLASTLIHLALQNCELDQEAFDSSVKKILQAKYWSGLNALKPIQTSSLMDSLKSGTASWLNYRLYEQSLTLLLNKHNLLPIKYKEHQTIASLVINDSLNNTFQQTLNKYGPLARFSISKDAEDKIIYENIKELSNFSAVIVSLHNTSTNATKNFNVTPQISKIIKLLNEKTTVILVVFGNAYVLSKIDDAERCEALLLAYEDTYLPQYLAAQALYGGLNSSGSLPVTPSGFFSKGEGLKFSSEPGRLKFTMPQDAGLGENSFQKIDSLAKSGIESGAYPGCEVLVSIKGKVVYQKAFGHHTYDSSRVVLNSDLYDIASVTKIASTALATMLLVEKGEIDLNKKVSKYLPELKKSNKKDIIIKEMLTHQAGFQAWIPFFESTLKNNKPIYEIYHPVSDVNYAIRVADSLYIKNDYPDKIWQEIIESEVKEKGKYVYSDLDLIIMQKIIEKTTGMPLDKFVNKNFYTSLGLTRLSYNPREKFNLNEIVPTELDTVFRHQLIHGDVHDPAAAMMGGVAGHAGVFSDAASLATIMQMLVNGGIYGNTRYLKKETIDAFTKRQYPQSDNRRGLVFDKPEYDPYKNGPTCKSAPMTTFGHTGFTGTCAWADPEKEIVFIFLSNRIHPYASNSKLANLNIRTEIQQVIYDSLNSKQEKR